MRSQEKLTVVLVLLLVVQIPSHDKQGQSCHSPTMISGALSLLLMDTNCYRWGRHEGEFGGKERLGKSRSQPKAKVTRNQACLET
jgi:hypothetical protein